MVEYQKKIACHPCLSFLAFERAVRWHTPVPTAPKLAAASLYGCVSSELDSICVSLRDKEAERSAKSDVKQDNSGSKCQSNKRKFFWQHENVAEGRKKRKWVCWLDVKTREKNNLMIDKTCGFLDLV